MDINRSAPVVYEESISIDANSESIWNILADFENWPNWNNEIQWVRLDGPIVEGAKFFWKAGPGKIQSQLKEIEKPTKIAWVGKTFGIHAIHVWELSEASGSTNLTTRESWDGIHVRLFRKLFSAMLEKSIHFGLESLKREAEKIEAKITV